MQRRCGPTVLTREDNRVPGSFREEGKFCRNDLASYTRPRGEVVFVPALPWNALGKVLKYEVRKGLIEREG